MVGGTTMFGYIPVHNIMMEVFIFQIKKIAKSIFFFITYIFVLFSLVACQNNTPISHNAKNNGVQHFEKLHAEEVAQITFISPSTKSSVGAHLPMDAKLWQEFLDKLTELEPRNKNTDNKKGWSYYFRIELKSGDVISISFLGKDIKINGYSYEINDYSDDELEYFCKTTE